MLSLLRARRGLAGVEFAILLPLLLTILCGVVDLSRAIIMARRLTVAADSVATIASTMAVQTAHLNALTGPQAWQATTAPFAMFPGWLSGPKPGDFAITLSSATFASAGSGYVANIAWSVANPAGQVRLRACGPLAAAADDAPSSLGALPVDAFGPSSILVADVSGVFQPVFTAVFLGPFTLQRSAYVSPRIDNGVALLGGYPGVALTCAAAS